MYKAIIDLSKSFERSVGSWYLQNDGLAIFHCQCHEKTFLRAWFTDFFLLAFGLEGEHNFEDDHVVEVAAGCEPAADAVRVRELSQDQESGNSRA